MEESSFGVSCGRVGNHCSSRGSPVLVWFLSDTCENDLESRVKARVQIKTVTREEGYFQVYAAYL